MGAAGAALSGAAVGWRQATERALYGEGGFYRRTTGPGAHFRTSVHASPLFAEALLRLARSAALDTVVDLGAGHGELLVALHRLDPALRLVGVEVAARPAGLPAEIEWCPSIPATTSGLLVANEWLDNVPVDVAERTDDGLRVVLVEPATGRESLGVQPTPPDAGWLERWWPLAEVGDRAEIGRPRDQAWAAAVGCLSAGVAVAVDYGHVRASRPAAGTLTGYRDGRQVTPVPDGSCDITAHVALDACAASGRAAGASATVLTSQRDALHALGVTAVRPTPELAAADPVAYVEALALAGQLAELRGRGGLGDFGWLLQSVGADLPAAARALSEEQR